MIRNVLAVVDVASPAFAGVVLQRATALATLDGAKLTVATVAPDFGVSAFGAMWEAGPMKLALDQANEMLKAFADKALPGLQATRYEVYYGAPEDRVPEALAATEADLLVIAANSAPLAAALAERQGLSVYLVGG